MSKEMIISVNGREKKIAILENGQATEFYIERGEDNSGVVGNIYKGRVQRVLPGMQSAFVDIGLERDAFLYVSDFFDEEEEIERIVMEKSKDKKSDDDLERETTDELHKKRLKRDKKIDNVQEKAEIETVPGDDEKDSDKDAKSKKTPARGKRGRPAKKDQAKKTKADKEEKKDEKKDEKKETKPRASRSKKTDKKEIDLKSRENVLDASDIEFGESKFERIEDDSDTGEMLKDAIMQEAITDKVRAIEFDMESTDSAEVGSLLDEVSKAGSGFQRIADEDDENDDRKPASKSRKSSAASKKTAAKKSTSKTSTRKKSAKSTTSKSKKSTAKKDDEKSAKLEDAEGSEKNPLDIAEMAVRRGSRGGKRKPADKKSTVKTTDPKTHNDKSYKASEADKPIVGDNEIADAEFKAKSKKGNGRRRRSRGRNKPQPKISDLLREGQEILVQIAKEPIARKGARITSHIALPGRYLVYMPTIEHLGVSRKISSSKERGRLRNLLTKVVGNKASLQGGFIVRTAGIGKTAKEIEDDATFLVKSWTETKRSAEKAKSPSLIHQDLDIILRLLRDHVSDEFTAIRVDSEEEYLRIVEFVNRIQPKLVKRIKFHTLDEPILDTYGVSDEIDKALKHRVWLKSGGYLVINQTEALIAIDVNTGKFVGKGNARLEDTITKTNMEAVEEISRQIRLRDLGGIIVLDLIDMEDRRNRNKVLQKLQEFLSRDKSPTKVLSFNDFGLIIMTRKRVKQSLERTLCSPCEYCDGAGWIKSAQTVCYEILDEARRISKGLNDVRQSTLRVHPKIARVLRESERAVLDEIEEYLGVLDVTGDPTVHQEQFDFAFI
ncbi:MAG: Rne/Rng family ribonuclease [Pyrinomonadaceae bacterium]|nr:Rne/Rng family ribonuclease [Pyrinomonadaceae bacterium]